MNSSDWFRLGRRSYRCKDVKGIGLAGNTFVLRLYFDIDMSEMFPNNYFDEDITDKLIFTIIDNNSGDGVLYVKGQKLFLELSQCIDILNKVGLSCRVEELKSEYLLSKLEEL